MNLFHPARAQNEGQPCDRQQARADAPPGSSSPPLAPAVARSCPTAADWRRFASLLGLMREGRGVCPTYRDIGAAWGFRGKASICRYLDRLQDFGLIRRLPKRARAIEITRFLVPTEVRGGDPVFLPDPNLNRRTT